MKKAEKAAVLAELARRELARRHYNEYLAYVQGSDWKRTKMSEFIAAKLQEFIEADTGSAYDILVIQTPPQHGKTATVTETLPSWYLGKYPRRRVILASYNDISAQRFCRRNRDKMVSFGESIFGLRPGKVNRANEFELENGEGRLISRGIMSGITGNPANLLIIDDPIKNRQEADSLTYRSRLWEEWQNSLKSRLAAGAKVVIIMTPWHEDDLAARILTTERSVTLLRLPVEAGENDPLGRKPGEMLASEEFSTGFAGAFVHGGVRLEGESCLFLMEMGDGSRHWAKCVITEGDTFSAPTLNVGEAEMSGSRLVGGGEGRVYAADDAAVYVMDGETLALLDSVELPAALPDGVCAMNGAELGKLWGGKYIIAGQWLLNVEDMSRRALRCNGAAPEGYAVLPAAQRYFAAHSGGRWYFFDCLLRPVWGMVPYVTNNV